MPKIPGGKLSGKQAAFVAAIKKNPKISMTQAGRIAGYKCAKQSANENLTKPPVINALKSYLRSLEIGGVNDKKSVRVISEAMDAKKVVYVESDSEGGKDREEIEDHAIRLKANEQYLRLKKLIGNAEDQQQQEDKIQIVIVNYAKADTDTSRVIPGEVIRSGDSSGLVKISADCMAQTGKKNNAIDQ